jgi:hypothetical protein
VPDGSGGGSGETTVIDDPFELGLFRFIWAAGGFGALPVISEHTTGGNPDGFVEFNYPSAPFLWLFRNAAFEVQPIETPFSIDTIDFSIVSISR